MKYTDHLGAHQISINILPFITFFLLPLNNCNFLHSKLQLNLDFGFNFRCGWKQFVISKIDPRQHYPCLLAQKNSWTNCSWNRPLSWPNPSLFCLLFSRNGSPNLEICKNTNDIDVKMACLKRARRAPLEIQMLRCDSRPKFGSLFQISTFQTTASHSFFICDLNH